MGDVSKECRCEPVAIQLKKLVKHLLGKEL